MRVDSAERTIEFIRALYPDEETVPLHAPRFLGNEKKYLADCIDSTYVSYVGAYVSAFEERMSKLTGSGDAIATVNGTTALHLALVASGIVPGEVVVTQALTFVATANAVVHAGCVPAFVDIDQRTLGMSLGSLEQFFTTQCVESRNGLVHSTSGRRVAAVVPMHTFGHPCDVIGIRDCCDKLGIRVIEDAAEALGSQVDGASVGSIGDAGVLSFNGNKIVTTGGGGMLLTGDREIASRARHLSTTAKCPHPYEFFHDEVGYNLRMPNVNAAIGCAQLEYLGDIMENKRETASKYRDFFGDSDIQFVSEPDRCVSNYWLNAVLFPDRSTRDRFLTASNAAGVQTRPAWTPMPDLPMFADCPLAEIPNTREIFDRLVNLPSSYRSA